MIIKKKALIMTWFNTNNYGTLLQSFATKEIFSSRYNIDIYFVRYNPKGKRDLVSVITKLFSLKAWKRQLKFKYSSFIFKSKNIDEKLNIRHKWLEKFTSEYYLANEGKYINSNYDFERLAKEYNIFIAGSDQIWNPQFVNEHFLLDFVPENKFCMSFASSLSVSEIPLSKEDIYKKNLRKFNGITIREKNCEKQLSNILGKKVNTILDPTLLFGGLKWLDYIQEKEEKNYVLSYFLGESLQTRIAANEIAQNKQMNLYHFSHVSGTYTKADEIMPKEFELWNVDPFEWLAWIKNASVIITDSFHMTVFSIMFHKNFYVVVKDEKNLEQNNRITNLLNMVGLEDCFVQTSELVDNVINNKRKINWENVDLIIERERMKSFEIVDDIVSQINSIG